MQVTVHLSPEAARELNSLRTVRRSTNALMNQLGQLKIELLPLHPGIDDPELATHFYATIASEMEANKLIGKLLELPSVTAAYIKPHDEPPK